MFYVFNVNINAYPFILIVMRSARTIPESQFYPIFSTELIT